MFHKYFKPKIHNVLPAGLATIVFWAVMYNITKYYCSNIRCLNPGDNCKNFFIKILPECCGCYTFTNFLSNLFLAIIVPFIFIYLLSSVIKWIAYKKH